MYKLILKNISKYYEVNKTKRFYALNDINISFPSSGLVSIIGKSGSGKSTLLNIIAHLDIPSSGDIYLDGKKYDKTAKAKFYQDEIGIIFQSYHLLDDLTVMENVSLPLLIKGYKRSEAIKIGEDILGYVNISKKLFKQKCSLLSGGEKQRIAIARAIIKNPKILICDEPTGALDSSNSEEVLKLIKNISKNRLVIMVSHNLQQVKKYSDRIIELSDGKINKDKQINNIEIFVDKSKKRTKHKSNWIYKFSIKNFIKRFKRNIFVIASFSISLIMSHMVFGFIFGKDTAIKNACYNQLDFGCGTISQEEFVSNSGMLKLVKSVRPDYQLLNKDPKISSAFNICPNFSSILPQNIGISHDYLTLEDMSYVPIFSFEDNSVNHNLLIKGSFPSNDTLLEVILNEKAYKNLKKIIKKEPLNEIIKLEHQLEINYVLESNEYISDTFNFNIETKVVGVVKELNYLSSNKIYYSYLALENYMQENVLVNLSTYFDNKITWYDRVFTAEDYSYISAYSYSLYLKDYRYRNYLFESDIFSSNYTFTSSSILISNSLINFLDVARYALILFLIISLIGAVLIISIMSFTNYQEDRKISAILSTLGAKSSNIEDIYLNESIISGIISFLLSIFLSIPLSNLINKIIGTKLQIFQIIKIPFLKYLNVPFLYPAIIFVALFLLISFATIVPIKFSKKNSIKGELQSND